MRVSVIIPSFEAWTHLGKGLASIARAWTYAKTRGMELEVEALVSLDDGKACVSLYQELAEAYPFSRIIKNSNRGTWPSRARNRAMSVASGDYFAVLDSDDSWSENYLAALLPLARDTGIAFGRTRVVLEDQDFATLAELPIIPSSDLTLSELGQISGSFHPLVNRSIIQRNILERAQDVWSAAVCLEHLDGRAPLARDAFYQLHLRGGSMTTEDHYSTQVSDSYQRLKALATRLGKNQDFINVWQDKFDLNQQFMAEQQRLARLNRPLFPSFYHWRVSMMTVKPPAA